MSPIVTPTDLSFLPHSAAEKAESLCLFLCSPNGFPKENIVSVFEPSGSDVFSKCRTSLTSILPYNTQRFLCESLKYRDAHYVLLLTNKQQPLLVVTVLSGLGGLCLALALGSDPETVLAFMRTIPTISCRKDPAFDAYAPSSEYDPSAFEEISRTFRCIFPFFESVYSAPATYSDPIALFRLLQMKLHRISAAFDIRISCLMQHMFDEPPRTDAVFDTDLFAASTLLLFSLARLYGIDDQIHAVFMTVDRYPAICFHFRADSDLYEKSPLLKYVKLLCARKGSYFKICHGEHARKESQKIPGIGLMIRNDRYAAIGDHVLIVFSPTKRNWTEYINRSPIFHLPDHFFEGFELFPSDN